VLIINPKENYVMVKKTTMTEAVSLNRLHWFGHVHRMEEDKIPNKVFYMDLETTKLKGRPRNRCQDEVKEDGKLTAGKG
jgi:hypothetical protein